MAERTKLKRKQDNVLNEKCWYKHACQYLECSGCIRYLEMNYLMEHSGIPPAKRRPLPISPTNDHDLEMFDKLQDIKDNIVDFVQKGSSLYIASNNTGNGKTTWALKIMMKYFDQIWAGNGLRTRALFVHVPTLLNELKNFHIPVSPSYIKQLKECDLVVWDDIASTELSNFDYSQLLSFIDYRTLAEKSNIYTGNLETMEEVNAVLGPRITSRVFSNNTEVIILRGKDMR